MKKVLVAAVLVCFGALGVQAQNAPLKIGYADVEYIYSKMPEAKQVESELQAHNTQLQNQLQAKYKEFQEKLQVYQQQAPQMVDAVRQSTEEELAQMEQNIQKFQQQAQASLENKRTTLMEPVYTKLGNAIEAVATSNNYAYILSGQIGGMDIVLYAKPEYNVSDLVLKEMGITPAK